MAQAGKTPIQLYRTTTSATAPSSGNLVAGELAININDSEMALYTENSSGTVTRVINNPAGLTYPTADGTSGQFITTNGSGAMSFNEVSSGGSLQAVASGSLANGDKVVVNSDGTVSVVTQTVGPPSAGSEFVFNSAESDFISSVYDSTNQKVIIAYRDNGNSYYGTAVVGTVSGTTITFGSEVVFNTAASPYNKITYDSTSQKVVIVFTDNGNANYGTAIVGTVSGTSISFGTKVVFKSRSTDYKAITYDTANNKIVISYHTDQGIVYLIVGTVSGTSISFGSELLVNNANTYSIAITYNSTAQKVVVAYTNSSSSGQCAVGTVSGTSISIGTKVNFNNAETYEIGITYDANADKVVIGYMDYANSEYGTAIVGTVSGTSISFGSEVVFNAASTNNIQLAYSSSDQKVVIAFRDGGNSGYGTAIVGTVSGTSISFGSEVVFNSVNTAELSISYVGNSQNFIISYQDTGNSNYGTSCTFNIQTLSTNLTSENYIGISNGSYSNGQTATIQIITSVDDAQSGLTAGQAYYVQPDGTLSETPGTPSVFAGTAISATKLAIKG